MAEKLFEEGLAKSGSKQNIKVFSAGISAMDGDKARITPSLPAAESGIDLSEHRSARLTRATVENLPQFFA